MRKTNWDWYKERLAALGFKSYKEYLTSEYWVKQKEKFYDLQEKPYHCGVCGDFPKTFNVHHRTYKRIGQENLVRDLVLLCRKCHKKVHRIQKGTRTQLIHIDRMLKKKKFNKKKYDRFRQILRDNLKELKN